jgi:hypothetical protein
MGSHRHRRAVHGRLLTGGGQARPPQRKTPPVRNGVCTHCVSYKEWRPLMLPMPGQGRRAYELIRMEACGVTESKSCTVHACSARTTNAHHNADAGSKPTTRPLTKSRRTQPGPTHTGVALSGTSYTHGACVAYTDRESMLARTHLDQAQFPTRQLSGRIHTPVLLGG